VLILCSCGCYVLSHHRRGRDVRVRVWRVFFCRLLLLELCPSSTLVLLPFFGPSHYTLSLTHTYVTLTWWLVRIQIVLDSKYWKDHMPDSVEAIFGNRAAHAEFIKRYGRTEADFPHLELDLWNWETPLRVA
jgi:hypothetical protein